MQNLLNRWDRNRLNCLVLGALLFAASNSLAQSFHGAPPESAAVKNPFPGAVPSAKAAYKHYCARCHGDNGEGSGNIPPLAKGPAQAVPEGSVFWYVTKGDADNGMPAWASLSARTRWQIISYVRNLGRTTSGTTSRALATPAPARKSTAPAPKAPFTDYRFERPGTIRRIQISDLPAPYATPSATSGPKVVARPPNAWPKAPPGFKVQLFATGLTNPRVMRIAPNGDIFLAETSAGDIKVLRGITSEGKPKQVQVFAAGLNTPFGIAFYPLGPDPQWVYVANMDSVVRFPYTSGDMSSSAPPQQLFTLPSGGHHRSRDVQFSADGKKMYVSVGSHENVGDDALEEDRADIIEFNPDGSGKRVYASGIRNPVGIAIHPKTGELWASVNERDGLGNDLVPDYITHVQEGGFYGWPWWYTGAHQDPRFEGKHPELKEKVIVPDVILQPHNASLEMAFYEGKQFPAEYEGDIFAAEHGSWNRSPRTGYEVIRVPLHQTGHASGEYEDFLTGFVVDDDNVWGRPVGVAVAPDGSLLASDDASGSIWRVTYSGKTKEPPEGKTR
jgi:glucose/arabinose dehydrogenase/cytochrome c553